MFPILFLSFYCHLGIFDSKHIKNVLNLVNVPHFYLSWCLLIINKIGYSLKKSLEIVSTNSNFDYVSFLNSLSIMCMIGEHVSVVE